MTKLLLAARPIDRMMRARYAKPISAMLSLFLTSLFLLQIGGGVNGLQGAAREFRANIDVFVIFAAIFSAAGWWTVTVWQRFWRRGRDDWENLVYNYGVRCYGALISLFLIVWVTWKIRLQAADDSTLIGYFGIGLMTGLFIATPVALMLGYIWGLTMARFFGIKKTPRTEASELPLVTDKP